jgi:hypothetical protein
MGRRTDRARRSQLKEIAGPKTASIAGARARQWRHSSCENTAMSTFQLAGITPEPFAPLFALPDTELAARGARRVVATQPQSYPCRVSLLDAEVGEELLLLPYEHQPVDSPYRSSGAIYVRKGAARSVLPAGEVPGYVSRRLISVRAYDAAHMMIAAEVREGTDVGAQIEQFFADQRVDYIHLHNARRGCFSCLAARC